MNRRLLQLLQASMIAALLPLAACMVDEPESDDEEDVVAVEGEIEIGVVEEGAGTSDDGVEAGELEPSLPGANDVFEDVANDYTAFGQTMPGGDRMAEPIPYPSDDPPKDTKMWPGDPSDPAPDDQH